MAAGRRRYTRRPTLFRRETVRRIRDIRPRIATLGAVQISRNTESGKEKGIKF